MESFSHVGNCFVTLTYSDDSLPALGALDPVHLQNFLKRLRRAYEREVPDGRFRFYAVGEYGDKSWRPHYHLSLFGIDPSYERLITDSWSLRKRPIGHVLVTEFNEFTAQYCAGYVTKKMTKGGDPRLQGLPPEFARQSLKPGLGALSMSNIAAALQSDAGKMDYLSKGIVPHTLKMGKKSVPLGRYLMKRILNEAGITPDLAQAAKDLYSWERSIELQDLFYCQFTAEERKTATYRQALIKSTKQRVLNFETRHNIGRARTL